MDLAKQQYSIRLQEGLFPSLQAHGQTVMEGWVLKQLKKPYRLNEQQKAYLEAKFNIGQSTGRKVAGCRLKRNTPCPRQRRGKTVWRFGIPNPPAGVFLLVAPGSKVAPTTSRGYTTRYPCGREAEQFFIGKSECCLYPSCTPSYYC